MEDQEEEQAMEIEALEAIFLEDCEVVSPVAPREVNITIYPIPGDDNDSENKVGIKLNLKLPKEYPTVLPDMKIEGLKGLTEKHTQILLETAKEEAENNLGMPMIFTISEILKEWLIENNRDQTDQSMYAQMMAKVEDAEREKQKDEEYKQRWENAENEDGGVDQDDEDIVRPVTGTVVTSENFTEWLNKFAKEKEEERLKLSATKDKSKSDAPDAHMTGREYFENQLDKEPSDGETISDKKEEWDADIQEEELFLGDDDDLDDLDDLDSSDED